MIHGFLTIYIIANIPIIDITYSFIHCLNLIKMIPMTGSHFVRNHFVIRNRQATATDRLKLQYVRSPRSLRPLKPRALYHTVSICIGEPRCKPRVGWGAQVTTKWSPKRPHKWFRTKCSDPNSILYFVSTLENPKYGNSGVNCELAADSLA